MMQALKKAGEFFGSIRVAIILLIMISVVSLLGVLIPQGLPQEQYLHRWGESGGHVILAIGVDRLFSALWFYLLLVLFSCNILVCSSTRLWKNARSSLRKSFLPSKTSFGQFKHSMTFSSNKESSAARDAALAYLKRRRFGIKVQDAGAGIQIAARKGLLKDIGSLVFHVSIVILLVGGLVGTRYGYSIVKQLENGQVTEIPDRSFLLRCDWFKLERNDAGAIKDYLSKLTILSNDGATLAEKVIEVNSPLTYKGIRFYQSTYGMDPTRATDVALRIIGPGLPASGFNGTVPYDSAFVLPNTDLTVLVSQFIPDFIIDMETRQASSRSDNPNNPAVNVMLFRGKDTLYNHWAFFKFPEQHVRNETFTAIADWYTPSYFTGIQVRENPGEGIIWFGILCMTFGIIAVFYVSRKSLWVLIGPRGPGGNSEVSFGWTSTRAAGDSQAEFERTGAALKEILR
jgi:cytochrome c biogenesis protein